MKMRSLTLYCLMLAVALPLRADTPDLNAGLREASMKGDLNEVKSLLSKGAAVDAATEFGATALIFASDRGYLEIVRTLIEHGADVNHKDATYESTPITWAAYSGHAQVVALLLVKGATDAADTLDQAIEREHLEVVKVVLASGKVPKESLSLTLAAVRQQGATEVAEMLVAAGATPLPRASSVMTAEQLAACVGAYHNEGGRELSVSVDDGRLMVTGPGRDMMELSPKGGGIFQLVGAGPVTLSFNMEGAQVTGLTVKPPDMGAIYKKVPKATEEPKKEGTR